MTSNPNDAYTVWLEAVAAEARFGPEDKIGTANYIDAASRRRAADAIRTGICFSLARSLELGHDENYYRGSLEAEATITPYDALPHRPPSSDAPVSRANHLAQITTH